MKLTPPSVVTLSTPVESALVHLYHLAFGSMQEPDITYINNISDPRKLCVADHCYFSFYLVATERNARAFQSFGKVLKVRSPLMIDNKLAFILQDRVEDIDSNLSLLRTAEIAYLTMLKEGYTVDEAFDILPSSVAVSFLFTASAAQMYNFISGNVDSTNLHLKFLATEFLKTYKTALPIAGKALDEALFHKRKR